MRFYNLITKSTQDEINEVIMSMTSLETEQILDLYSKVSLVEYTDEIGFECMFAILDNHLIDKLSELYSKYSINFKIIDITKDVILDNQIKTKYKNYTGHSCHRNIVKLIKEYKMNWVSKDDILDKILEKGIDSLTKLDFEILNY